MIFNLYEDEKNNSRKRLIKDVLIGTIIFLLIIIVDILFLDLLPIYGLRRSQSINSTNYVLGIISIACCSVYYYMYKSNEFFILNLSYISITIEYILINILIRGLYEENILKFSSIILPFIFRAILLTLAVFNNSKVVKVILKRKGISVLATIIITILSIIGELAIYYNINNKLLYENILLFNDVIVVYYYILLVLLAKKCLERNQFIYTIIISSLSIFNMRRINVFESINININIKDIFAYRAGLAFVGFIILLIGLFIETINKIKESEKLTEELQNNQKMLLTITENIKDLIITEDCLGNITYANNIALNKLGCEREELYGKKLKDFIYSEKNVIGNDDENIILKEQIWKSKNGDHLSVESIISNITEEKKRKLSKIIVARDCSFREELENLEKKYNEIKEVENIRSQFFANLSHEFKTPINIIYSCVQIFDTYKNTNDKDLGEIYRKYDKTIKQNCFRMLRLINNLVDITKIDSGFIKAKLINYDIVSLVEEISLSTIPYVKSKNINIIFDTTIEELIIKCSPEYIERIILNLLSNAVKFTDDGGNILVYIDSDENWVTIKVKDDGVGIPSELKHVIFDRFVQIDKSFTRANEGSGIGLALVKALVELQDGEIYLDDNVSVGSEFIIKLPNKKLELNDEINNDFIEKSSKPIIDTVSIEFSDIYELMQ